MFISWPWKMSIKLQITYWEEPTKWTISLYHILRNIKLLMFVGASLNCEMLNLSRTNQIWNNEWSSLVQGHICGEHLKHRYIQGAFQRFEEFMAQIAFLKERKTDRKKLFFGRMILGKVWNVQRHTKNSGQLDKGREWSVSSNFLKLETDPHRVDPITWHVLHLKFCSLDHKLLKAGKCLSDKLTDRLFIKNMSKTQGHIGGEPNDKFTLVIMHCHASLHQWNKQ